MTKKSSDHKKFKNEQNAPIKRVGICPSKIKSHSIAFIEPIATYLLKHGFMVFIDEDFTDHSSLPKMTLDTEIDLYITIGGDGTLLAYNQKYIDNQKALFTCVNLGRLGFLADVAIENIENYLSELVKGNYTIDERTMIEGISPEGKLFVALNDFVFHRASINHMVQLEVRINGHYFNTFQADGIVVSTPTGSTAYSMAAGGPLVDPKLKAFIITPICAHSLASRPFITPNDCIIEIECLSNRGNVNVIIDGVHNFPLNLEEKISLCNSPTTFRFLSFHKNPSFFSAVRSKLCWSGSSQ